MDTKKSDKLVSNAVIRLISEIFYNFVKIIDIQWI